MQITDETPILFAPEGAGVWSEATLGEFIAANSTTINDVEKRRIIADLADGEVCENVPGPGAVYMVALPDNSWPDVIDHMSEQEKADWAAIGKSLKP